MRKGGAVVDWGESKRDEEEIRKKAQGNLEFLPRFLVKFV